jgi:hypothetical protein
VKPARRKDEGKTQDYTAKHREDGSRTSREEMAGNNISEKRQDQMTNFHTCPMPL